MPATWQERIGSLISAAGVAWGVKVATDGFSSLSNLVLPTGGPLELSALGILLWIYAKYRRSVVLR
jgi:hypothetical protein